MVEWIDGFFYGIGETVCTVGVTFFILHIVSLFYPHWFKKARPSRSKAERKKEWDKMMKLHRELHKTVTSSQRLKP